MQEAYRVDPWALLVGTILFNMVQGKKARPVLERFLDRWPTPQALWLGDGVTEAIFEEMERLFRPLGFQKRRAERIWRMSFDFLVLRPDVNPEVDILELHGIGKYGADSYNIFCRGFLVEDVTDKELRRYVEWAKSREGTERPSADSQDCL